MYTPPTASSDLSNTRAEFWGDLQVDFYTQNSTLFLANQRLETVLSTNGRKAHRPILSQPSIRTYTPGSDLTFDAKVAEDQSLSVDTFPTAAEIIDLTAKYQTPFDLLAHSSKAIRQGLMNKTEQIYLSKISDAANSVNGGNAIQLSVNNVGDILEQADGILGANDVPTDTALRAMVIGPRTLALMRKARSDKETPMGDSVDSRGVVGPWRGWTVVSSNNLPWSATLTLNTNPTNGDTITILGRVLEFQQTLSNTTAGRTGILIGASAAATRVSLAAFFAGTGTQGTDYTQPDNVTAFMLRNKRGIAATTAAAMAFTGYGDITVSASLTASGDGWSAQRQQMAFMMRGSIDLVMQFMELRISDAENRFADKPKGLIGVGAKTFQDGALSMVNGTLDVSAWQ